MAGKNLGSFHFDRRNLSILRLELHPIIESMVSNQARIASVEAINEAVMEELAADSVSYTDLVQLIERADPDRFAELRQI